MLFLYRFFLGILEIEIYGVYPEKVLNLCEKNKISIWDITFKKGKICCKINVKDFKKMPSIFRKKGIRVHILKRAGLPFFTNKYKRRSGIFIGLFIFFLLLNYLSGFVWIIDVKGNKKVSDMEIISYCKEIGIKEGIWSKKIDPKNKAQELLLKCDKLSWASFNIEGCVLTVDVTEVTPKKDTETSASNLVANCDGIIKHIDVTVGNCIVKVGDTVKKGDLLVSGIIEGENDTKFVKSRGKIIADTTNDVTLSQNYKIEEFYITPKQKNKYVLEVLTFKIPLYLGQETGYFETVYRVKNLKWFGNFIPIKIHKKHFVFKQKQDVELDFNSACERLSKRLKNNYPNAVIKEEFINQNYKAIVNAVVYQEKDIATSQNLFFSIQK